MNDDEIEDLRQLLAAHRQTLAILLKQVAAQGEAHAPPAQINGIAEARGRIAELKQALRERSVEVEDAPADVETSVERAAAGAPVGGVQIANADIAGVVDAHGADFSGARGVRITGVQIGNATKKPRQRRKK